MPSKWRLLLTQVISYLWLLFDHSKHFKAAWATLETHGCKGGPLVKRESARLWSHSKQKREGRFVHFWRNNIWVEFWNKNLKEHSNVCLEWGIYRVKRGLWTKSIRFISQYREKIEVKTFGKIQRLVRMKVDWDQWLSPLEMILPLENICQCLETFFPCYDWGIPALI